MVSRLLPPPLRLGARIGLIAPSSPVYEEENRQKAVAFLGEMGFAVTVGESCTAQRGYLSGTDEVRARDVNRMFQDPGIKGIVCLRGGYGAARLLPLLDYDMIRRNPKPFVGYSDITALHCAFQVKCGLVTFHGPMAGTPWPEDVRDGWRRALEGAEPLCSLNNPDGTPFEAFREGEAAGVLTGGNLTVFTNLLGTPYMPDLKGKLLLLEDVGEKPYRIDAMLTQLRNAGAFAACAGIILGDFTKCDPEPEKPSLSLPEIFADLLPADKPILMSVHAGHGPDKITLPLNIPYRISGNTLRGLCPWTLLKTPQPCPPPEGAVGQAGEANGSEQRDD